MPIKRYSMLDGRPSHFHITEKFEVYDNASALAIDHLLNHLKLLLDHGGTQDLIEHMAKHPNYAQENFDENLTDILFRECVVLLNFVVKILDAKPVTQNILLEEMKAKVPFFNYRYPRETYPPK